MSNIYYDNEIKFETMVEGKLTRKVKSHDGTLMLVELYFENGGVGAMHKHDDHEQSTYCLEGEFEFTLDNEKFLIKAGDTLYIPKGVLHEVSVKSEKGRLLDVFTPQKNDLLQQK